MVFTRRKTVPGPSYNVAEMVHGCIPKRGRIKNPLERIKQTKTFLRAKLVGGLSTTEAKKVSGLPPTLSLSNIKESPFTKAIVAELCKEVEFGDPGLVKRLKEMWYHKKMRSIKVDGPTMVKASVVEEDDTDLWKYSMDRVLQLKGYLKQPKEVEQSNEGVVTGGITFNVLTIPNDTQESQTSA